MFVSHRGFGESRGRFVAGLLGGGDWRGMGVYQSLLMPRLLQTFSRAGCALFSSMSFWR
jgi:hypothetical protein